jgi:hypothetical protein
MSNVMDEQTIFNQYLSGEITFAQYIGRLNKLNEKHIQNQRSEKENRDRELQQREEFFTKEDNLFI